MMKKVVDLKRLAMYLYEATVCLRVFVRQSGGGWFKKWQCRLFLARSDSVQSDRQRERDARDCESVRVDAHDIIVEGWKEEKMCVCESLRRGA